jgi:hypothetical protein
MLEELCDKNNKREGDSLWKNDDDNDNNFKMITIPCTFEISADDII